MAKLIEATYGDALFELAVEESRVDSLYDEAGAVIEAFDDNPEFGRLLNHPEVEKGEKEDWLIQKRFEDNKESAEKEIAKNKDKKRIR